METIGGNSDLHRDSFGGGTSGGSRRYGLQFSPSAFMQAPISTLLECTGIMRPARFSHSEGEGLIGGGGVTSVLHENGSGRRGDSDGVGNDHGEVSIRIIGPGDQDRVSSGAGSAQSMSLSLGRERSSGRNGVVAEQNRLLAGRMGGVDGVEDGVEEGIFSSTSSSSYVSPDSSPRTDGEAGNVTGGNNTDTYQRYDIQQVVRWMEQILPFSLLLLVVFIWQHFQGFFITFFLAVLMFKSNDILRKQTALKGERKIHILLALTIIFTLHVGGFYLGYRNDDLLYPLLMLPPKSTLPFSHAIFIIIVNDTMMRQAAMGVKCILLIYYKNSRGRNCRQQGPMLTLVEYLMLFYRALLPAPVWYRFFLNKEYGSLFSSLTTGLYLTFKLTSIIEKVQCFYTALKALSCKDMHYGSYATSEQIIAAGDLCAICQEKMHAPILLCCKHIFCEDCASEWFERERTCPLCRALVKPTQLKSFADGSTSLFFQLF